MHSISSIDVMRLVKAALDPGKGGATIHRQNSEHGRYIVGGMGKSIHMLGYTAMHPATINHVTTEVCQRLRQYVRAETIGSWRDVTTGSIYIDLGTTHDDLDTAKAQARLRGERAIYDSSTDETIWIKR